MELLMHVIHANISRRKIASFMWKTCQKCVTWFWEVFLLSILVSLLNYLWKLELTNSIFRLFYDWLSVDLCWSRKSFVFRSHDNDLVISFKIDISESCLYNDGNHNLKMAYLKWKLLFLEILREIKGMLTLTWHFKDLFL